MAYKLKQSGDYRKRRNFSMIKNSLAISDLLEVQTESYKWFATEGIKEVFETFSPIEKATAVTVAYCFTIIHSSQIK